MRGLLSALVVLIGVGLFANHLRLVSVQPGVDRALTTAPDLASPSATGTTDTPDARRTEYCGPTRLAAVRRVTELGEGEALMGILPPSRWEAWPAVVSACNKRYGPAKSRTPR